MLFSKAMVDSLALSLPTPPPPTHPRSGGEQYLANHLWVSQSARAKSIIRLCGIY